MLAEDYSLQFEGFNPSEETIKKIRIALSDLYAKSPHRSFLKATFKSSGKLFEGEIDITSQAGKFAVSLNDKDLESLSRAAVDKIRWQLDVWKSKRFL